MANLKKSEVHGHGGHEAEVSGTGRVKKQVAQYSLQRADEISSRQRADEKSSLQRADEGSSLQRADNSEGQAVSVARLVRTFEVPDKSGAG